MGGAEEPTESSSKAPPQRREQEGARGTRVPAFTPHTDLTRPREVRPLCLMLKNKSKKEEKKKGQERKRMEVGI